MNDVLEAWIAREYKIASHRLLAAVSPVALTYRRAPFDQTMTVREGAVLASTVPGAYDPDPDYFFHWLRDSAIAIDAVRVLAEDAAIANGPGLIDQFVRFSLGLNALDGAGIARWDRSRVAPTHVQFLRPPEELAALRGDAVPAEARFNPDGTLDILLWARPQHDGPALRALALLRAWPLMSEGRRAPMSELLRQDLTFVERQWERPSFDIWEEDLGTHYYTQLVQAAALKDGSLWLALMEDEDGAQRLSAAAEKAFEGLEAFWDPMRRILRAHLGPETEKDLDSAVVLGVLHAARAAGPHSAEDTRVEATLDRLAEMFAAELPINRVHRAAPALGRYRTDAYYGGGAWYIATLAAAELHFELAAARASKEHLKRGDAFLETVRAFTPEDGALSEQIDRTSGSQISAKHLTWSYAGFITAHAARKRAQTL